MRHSGVLDTIIHIHNAHIMLTRQIQVNDSYNGSPPENGIFKHSLMRHDHTIYLDPLYENFSRYRYIHLIDLSML